MLKAGRDTGSLTNHLYSRMTKNMPEPVVGMGATLLSWTDREAATIVQVVKLKNGGWIVAVTEDTAKRIDSNGFSESQEYEYTSNPDGARTCFRYEDGKGWRQVRETDKGRWKLTGGKGLLIGAREKYHDFSF